MVNSAKRPNRKGSKLSETELQEHAKSLGTDNVGVEAVSGKYRLSLSRRYARQYYGKPQHRVSSRLSILDDDGRIIQDNVVLVRSIANEMHKDLALGYFDPTLVKYGLGDKPQFEVLTGGLPPKPKLGTLEIWEKYLEYKKPTLKETTFVRSYKNKFSSAIKQAIEAVGDDSICIRKWLLDNRSLWTVKPVLVNLREAYQLAIKEKLTSDNPFEGLTDDLPKKNKNQKVNLHDEESEVGLYDPEIVKRKAFTVDEVNAILEYVQESRGRHHHSILRFLFLTGCRTGEAIALHWGDIKFDKGIIVIDKSYDRVIRRFVTTKTSHARLFPMPKNGELWKLLSSLKKGKDNELVFTSKTGKVVDHNTLYSFWRGCDSSSRQLPGVIPTLVKQGKVSKYLPLYHTRHTFISYQINEAGIAPHEVKDWCGHSERMTTDVYREVSRIAKPMDYGQRFTSQDEESEVDKLKRKIEQLEALMAQMQ